MAKVKFNTKMLDKATGEIYEPSDKFVDVSEQLAGRIKAIQSADPRHKDSFEFAKSESKAETPEKGKKAKKDD